MKKLIFLIFIILSNTSLAEYRVYQYYVKSKFSLPYDQNAYLVTSTLDPTSYLSYNGGSDSINIELLRTWMCNGHTGGQSTCPAPYDNQQEGLENEMNR